MKRNDKGITLIALVVTIIVLLILAAVSISAVVGDNGIATKAKKSKLETEISQEKEYINLAVSSKKIDKNGNGDFSDISSNELQEELDKLVGKDKTRVFGTGKLIVLFMESDRYYNVDGDGKIDVDDTEKTTDETPGILIGNGTESNPYIIDSIEDLVAFSKNVQSGNTYEGLFIKLNRTLNFKSPNSYVNFSKAYEEFGDINTVNGIEIIFDEMNNIDGTGFIPIGIDTAFKGCFDGGNYYIENLYINTLNGYAAVFSKTSSAIIKNLNVTGEVYGKNVAGIVGYSSGGTISNCKNYVKLSGTEKVFGISYSYDTLVEYCENYSDINCEAVNINGIAYSGTIKYCNNYGNIFSNKKSAIAGIADMGTINSCNNYGNLKIITNSDEEKYSEAHANGISSFHGKTHNSINYGDIYVEVIKGESNYAGCCASGIGSAYAVNYGDITAIGSEVYSGGISANLDTVSLSTKTTQLYIENCCNFGNLQNNMNVDVYWAGIRTGGIIGCTNGNLNVYNCFNSGEILSYSNISKSISSGGIAGSLLSSNGGSWSTMSNVKNCINIGNVKVTEYKGNLNIDGIIGYGGKKEENLYNLAEVITVTETVSPTDEITLQEMMDVLNAYVSEKNATIADEELKLHDWKIDDINGKEVLIIE